MNFTCFENSQTKAKSMVQILAHTNITSYKMCPRKIVLILDFVGKANVNKSDSIKEYFRW